MDIFGFYMPTWLFVIFALTFLYVVYMSRNMLVFYNMGIEGPTPIPVFGNFISLMRKGFMGAESVWYKERKGKVFGMHECCYPILQICDREMMRQILVKDFDKFTNRRIFPLFNEPPLDKALTIIVDDHWKHVRAKTTPAFSVGKLKRMIELIDRSCDVLVENVAVKAASKEDFELKDFCGSFTMDVIANTAFGLEIDAQKNPDEPFVKHAKNFFEPPAVVILILFFAPFLGPLLPRFIRRRLFGPDHINFFMEVIHQAIKQRQTNKQEFESKDLLQSMLDHLVDEKEIKESPTGWSTKGLSLAEVLAQSIIFFIAGFETTATTLSLTLYNLAIHPDLLAKAIAEVDEKLGENKLDYEKVSELTYLEMCINETLRLYPPAPRFDRVADCDVTIEGIAIKKGMLIAFPIHAIHRDPNIWEDPERFDPERFSPENKSSIGPYDFMPFGYGPRNCIGLRLAYIEMKMALARILLRFKPALCAKSQVPLTFKAFGMLHAEKGMWVKMESRDI